MLPPDDVLAEEIRVMTYNADDGKIRIIKKKLMRDILKRSPDRLDALILTFAESAAGDPKVMSGRAWEMAMKMSRY
jgi:hypothetical protein